MSRAQKKYKTTCIECEEEFETVYSTRRADYDRAACRAKAWRRLQKRIELLEMMITMNVQDRSSRQLWNTRIHLLSGSTAERLVSTYRFLNILERKVTSNKNLGNEHSSNGRYRDAEPSPNVLYRETERSKNAPYSDGKLSRGTSKKHSKYFASEVYEKGKYASRTKGRSLGHSLLDQFDKLKPVVDARDNLGTTGWVIDPLSGDRVKRCYIPQCGKRFKCYDFYYFRDIILPFVQCPNCLRWIRLKSC